MTSQPELQSRTINTYTQILQWVQLTGCNISTLYTHTRGSKIVVHVWVGSFFDSWLPQKIARLACFWNLNLHERWTFWSAVVKIKMEAQKKWKTYWGCRCWVIVMIMILIMLSCSCYASSRWCCCVVAAAGGGSGGGAGCVCVCVLFCRCSDCCSCWWCWYCWCWYLHIIAMFLECC